MGNEFSTTGSFIKTDLAVLGLGLIFLGVHVVPIAQFPDGAVPAAELAAYGILLGTSTIVVNGGLSLFTGEQLTSDTDVDQDTGWLIGKMENVLVLTFVLQGAYTALSIIFAAKSFVRKEDISSGNTTYYLAGTLLNFTYSVAIGLVFSL
ncbi:hypothetical protein ACLI4U_11035 [Natrialbaceae archaeon A-CW2]|uniref:hypothetical protein n=1 Tax=Natronosalvus amylolyticus TaxID=2961994 RepID=UPI0020C93D6C|nr:hypothetical protein [Natronosalvus amylolyticus]